MMLLNNGCSVRNRMGEEMRMNCLIDALKVLRGSSKEAVENIKEFNSLKKYMHITRTIQKELTDIIMQATVAESKQLILVCGSVGDGKSHILSYLKNEKGLLTDFYVHNDATESLSPNMSSIETLDKILKGFRDENIGDGKREKVIIAINLGTLNNFIDSEIGKYYGMLHKYVVDSEILESYTHETGFNPTSPFQHINFSDYHLYHLSKNGGHVESDYIEKLIKKLVNRDEINPFYKAYMGCGECNICDKCPVKHNYELLQEEQVQKAIIEILVEAMIKHKIIISTRSLLNFFYDILIGEEFNKDYYRNLNYQDKAIYYMNALMPNLLYSHPDYSAVLEQVCKSDPMAIRSETVDEMIVRFNILDDVLSLVREYTCTNPYINVLEGIEINKIAKEKKSIKKAFLELFIRLYRLHGIKGKLEIEDKVYQEFVDALYYYNANDIRGLRGVYSNLREAIFKWNGGSSSNRVIVSLGKRQSKYMISQELKIKEHVQASKVDTSEKIERFVPYIIAQISDQEEKQVESVNIDYALFKLIRDIKNGYRPNIKDKNNFISFVNTIDRIYGFGQQKKELNIENKNSENKGQYVLKKTPFGFEFERVERYV